MLDATEGFVPPDPPELPLALAHVTEVGSRERTRIVCVYGLSDQVDAVGQRLGIADLYPFGRFSPHVRGVVAGPRSWAPPGSSTSTSRALRTGFGSSSVAQQVAHVLDVTCLKRGLLRLDGKTMIEWLREQAAIRGGATYWRLVFRVAAPREPAEQAGTFQPPELNYSGYVAVGRSQGVSVISGFARPVENMDALMVVMLVTGLGGLHRSRGRLFAAMTQAGRPVTASVGAARTEISELSAQLNESPGCSRSGPCWPCRQRCCSPSSRCPRRPAGRYSTRGRTGRPT